MTVLSDLPPPDPVTPDILREWEAWAASRPDAVRKMCLSHPPWNYYQMPKTRQIVTIEAYYENGTLRVCVVGDRVSIPAVVQFSVFGVPPGDLVALRYPAQTEA